MRLRPFEPWEVTAARLAGEALALAILAGFLLWPFRLYGFDLVDEGTQLAQIERAAAGERPYLDFETGYTPGYFALESALLKAGDGTIVAIRTFGVLLHAAVLGALWAITRAWVGGRTAAAVVLLYLAFFLPVSLRNGAPFNIPYPGWLAAPAALAAQVMVARTAARRIRRRDLLLMACGVASGLAFSVKPNSGLLALAATALALAPTWSPARRGDVLAAAMLRILAVVATALLLGPGLLSWYAVALGLPVLMAAARSAPSFEDGDPAWRQLGAVTLGFLLVVLPWFVPLVAELGVGGVLRDVFLLDGGVVEAYLVPFPAPGWSTVALFVGVGVVLLARERPAVGPWIAAATLVLMVLGALPTGARLASENVLLWLSPLLILFGLTEDEMLEESPRERAVLVFLAIYSLQLFPRPDSIHVAMEGAPLVVAAALIWRRRDRRWRSGLQSGRTGEWVSWAALGLAALLALGRIAPALVPRLIEPQVALGLGPRAPVVVVAGQEGAYRWIGEAIDEIDRHAGAEEPLFTFPDVAGVGFLAERPQPFHHLYFVPGRPDRAGEDRTLRRLEEVEPPVALWCEPHVEAFSAAPEYFARLGAELERAYAPAAEVGGCTVRARRPAS